MVTLILHCSHCGSDALVRDGHAPQRQAEVSLSRLRPSQPRASSSPCLSTSSSRGDSVRLPRTKEPAWPHPHVWDLSRNRVELDRTKVDQLPSLRTTLVAPDPEDPTSTTLELDERMARLGSNKRTTPGCGWPCVARRDRWSPRRLRERRKKTGQRLWENMPSAYAGGMVSPTSEQDMQR
jgi:hypothetical protein